MAVTRSVPAPSTPVLRLLGDSLRPVQFTGMAGCHLPFLFSFRDPFLPFQWLKMTHCVLQQAHGKKQQKEDFPFWQLWTQHKLKESFLEWFWWDLFSEVRNKNLHLFFSLFKPRRELKVQTSSKKDPAPSLDVSQSHHLVLRSATTRDGRIWCNICQLFLVGVRLTASSLM